MSRCLVFGPILLSILAAREANAEDSASGVAPSGDEVVIHGRRPEEYRGASDYRIEVGELAAVPRKNAAELLKLAPGMFLFRDGGGDGHADRIYLRGFDAREGQDIEFSLDGVPLNDVGNYHGNGYADVNFLIPELVRNLRVLEGPFDPHQGNFAVAGSAEFESDAPRTGLESKLVLGSFDTQRWLSIYTPITRERTYAALDLFRTSGFGTNRAAIRGRAMTQYEVRLSKTSSFRIGGVAYQNDYESPGVVRVDDVAKGTVDQFGTYDPNQGGTAGRYHVHSSFDSVEDKIHFRAQVFAISRAMRLRENYTGFLLDTQLARQELHEQRGDLLDLAMRSETLGARFSGRRSFRLFGRSHDVELGAYARLDSVRNLQQRLASQNLAPYATEAHFDSRVGDVSGYLDFSLRVLDWMTLRGGLRGGLFFFDVNDLCAVRDVSRPSANSEASCLSYGRFGTYREPNQASTTATSRLLPRATLLLGPFSGLLFSVAYGQGVRTIDPSYVTQDVPTPFAAIDAGEAGVTFRSHRWSLDWIVSSVFFGTHVDRDQIFNQTEGRNTLSTGTTRVGWAGSLRLLHPRYDVSANASLVRARFDDTGLLVPYVPEVVLRSEAATKWPLNWLGEGFLGRVALAVGCVGPRPLPFGERSQPIVTLDGALSLGHKAIELELQITNLLDLRYRQSEFNYASDFSPNNATTLVPSRMFSPGEPRAFYFGLRGFLDGGNDT